jgi:hypothetical protein
VALFIFAVVVIFGTLGAASTQFGFRQKPKVT